MELKQPQSGGSVVPIGLRFVVVKHVFAALPTHDYGYSLLLTPKEYETSRQKQNG